MEALRKTTFRRNTIANNDVALQMFSNSDANVFTENNFVNNLSPLQLVGEALRPSGRRMVAAISGAIMTAMI